jgi:hypothetical protein
MLPIALLLLNSRSLAVAKVSMIHLRTGRDSARNEPAIAL